MAVSWAHIYAEENWDSSKLPKAAQQRECGLEASSKACAASPTPASGHPRLCASSFPGYHPPPHFFSVYRKLPPLTLGGVSLVKLHVVQCHL